MVCCPVDVIINDSKFGFIKPLGFKADEYISILNNKDIRKHFTAAKDVEDITDEEFNKKVYSSSKEGCTIIAITNREDNLITDTIGLIKIIKRAEKSAEVSITLKQEVQHKGYGTYCMSRLIEWLYVEEGISNIHARCFTTDNVAGEFLKKCGFELNSMADGTFYFKYSR